MINSRDVSLLRPDVEKNVRALLRRCEAEGLPVLITQTVRDNEYQATLYAQGRTKPGKVVTKSKVTTFHGAGLAIDFCKNAKNMYGDAGFFDRVIGLAKEMGFSSGRDWKSFPESCHLQWDNHGKASYKNAPAMPEWEDDMNINSLSDDDIITLAARMQALLGTKEADMESKTGKELQEAIDMGITDGSRPEAFCTRKQAAIMVKRAKNG